MALFRITIRKFPVRFKPIRAGDAFRNVVTYRRIIVLGRLLRSVRSLVSGLGTVEAARFTARYFAGRVTFISWGGGSAPANGDAVDTSGVVPDPGPLVSGTVAAAPGYGVPAQ